MTIFAPSSYLELQQMLRDALDITSGPVAIRWPKTAARVAPDDQVGYGLNARRVREGGDLCILAVGKLVEAAEQAAASLAEEGIEATVWDARVVKPLDEAMIADACRHRLVITVEDGLREGGAGSAMADRISTHALESGVTAPPVRVLGTPVAYLAHGKPDAILAELGLDAAGIAAEARRLLGQLG
jgi:1-deoxy-D-xylulose-5-phosphate synthase